MRKYEYTVVFTNQGCKTVRAFNIGDAIILAKAEMIKDGCDHSVVFVKDEAGNVLWREWEK